MRPRRTILGAVLLSATTLAAQPTLQLCIVEPGQGFSSGESFGHGGGGLDARYLVKELSGRILADGTVLQPIPIIGVHRKDAETDAQRQGCPLIIELWNHHTGDMANQNGAPISANSPTVGIPGSVPAHGDPIDRGIDWAMRRNDIRKVIASGFAPPGLNRRQSVVKPYPIPVIANQIVDKLNRLPNRPTPRS